MLWCPYPNKYLLKQGSSCRIILILPLLPHHRSCKPFHVIVHELVIELERSTTRKKRERGDIHVLMAVPFRQKGKRGDKRINPGAPSNIFACLWCIVTSQSAEREPNCYRYDRRNVLACVTRLAPQISDDAPIYSFAMQLQATSSPS